MSARRRLLTNRQPARSGLPYGYWRCRSGRVVLFDRNFCPLWERTPGGVVRKANPREWVLDIVASHGFYNDGTPFKGLRENLQKVVADFLATGTVQPHSWHAPERRVLQMR